MIQTTTIQKWSTSAVPPAQRLEYWIGAICEGFLEMAVTTPAASRFHSSLESAPLGPIGVNRVLGSAQDVYRTRRAIAQSRENYFYLLCKPDASWHCVQDGRIARLLPGDAVLVDSRRCYEFHFPSSADTISLELAPWWVESWLAEPAQALARRIDGQSGWGQALSGFMRQLSPETAAAPPLPAALLTDQLGALLALATHSGIPARQAGAASLALKDRIADAVRQRYAEPGLTAGAVAENLGISTRTLHRCLAGHALTFGQMLADCRLATALRLLSEPRFDRLHVAEIGRRVGIMDPSHFTRQCRRRFGRTPGQLRRAR